MDFWMELDVIGKEKRTEYTHLIKFHWRVNYFEIGGQRGRLSTILNVYG